MKEYVAEALKWFVLNDEHPNSKQTDGCVMMLGYVVPKGVIELGFVARRLDGKYWNFTNNPNIYCRGYTGQYFDSADECGEELYQHVLHELCRLLYNQADFNYSIMTKFKKRDADAYKRYAPSTVKEAFQSGIDWVLRSEGLARRPSWATYSVQNRDGSMMWFENKPTQNYNKGIWECADGRSQKHSTHENWSGSLTKVA